MKALLKVFIANFAIVYIEQVCCITWISPLLDTIVRDDLVFRIGPLYAVASVPPLLPSGSTSIAL